MRYLIISNHAGMLLRYRGAVIKELLKSGEVTVCVPDGECEALENMGCAVINVEVDRRGMDPIKDLRLYRSYRRVIREVSPDAVITYSIKPNIYGGYACRRLGVPYFMHVQGLGSAFYRPILKGVVSVMYRIASGRARGVFFENQGNCDLFVNKRIIRKEQAITAKAGAGVPLEEFPYTEMPDGDGVTDFLFVGRIMREKGIDELFAASRRLKDELGDRVRIRVAGGFEDSYADTVKELDESGVIEYLGFVHDVGRIYAEAQAVVLPSYHEGLANVLIEGAAVGRALIATDVYGCRECVLKNESGYLIPVFDADALYYAMRSFASLSISEKREMGVRGRRHVEENFDRASVVAFTLERLNEGL